jgi:hydroxypyruvate isomerase
LSDIGNSGGRQTADARQKASISRQAKGVSMPKFCANLGFLFTDRPFLDRFAASAKAGFAGVEYSQPYGIPAPQILENLVQNQLDQVLFNLPAGDWDKGERGIACLPDRRGEFQDGVGQAIAYAKVLGNSLINCLAGIKPPELPTSRAFDTMVENLQFAEGEMSKAGLTLLVEPINRFDIPGFFLNTSAEAMAVIDATGSDRIKLQYDIYHMQRMEGELSATITRLFHRIGHFQCAGVPGRTEPDRGEINYNAVFGLIDRLGYTGWIGAEYTPVAGTETGLEWLRTFTSAR